MTKKTFFVTTPIYYTNAIPHIWNAYASLISDVIARYKRISGFDVKFSTGVDENSQKALIKAQELWMEIMDFLDDLAVKHKEIWDWLDITYTDFIRTTDEKHHKFVKEILKKTYEAGYIYKWYYEWLYCIWCESFKKPEELNEKWCCPDHLTKPDVIKEENYFFSLSKFQKQLEEYYGKNPNFTIPNHRFAEMKTFLDKWLEDFSISRNKKLFWIPLPFDENQVTYVWYDALLNYLTVCQGWDERFWPADLHVVWKEIARFHVIYWPAMLLAAWYSIDELPKNIMVTWFLTIDWQKISKSLWNAIDPVAFSQKHSRDMMLLYLLSATTIWQDWDFSEEQAILMFNAKLANTLGNLVNRVVVLSLKLEEGELKWKFDNKEVEKRHPEIKFSEIDEELSILKSDYIACMDSYDLKWALDKVFAFLNNLNTYMNATSPWEMFSDIDGKRWEIRDILYTVAECLRVTGLFLFPFFEEKMTEMFLKLWLADYPESLKDWELPQLIDKAEAFVIKEKWNPLYPRI
ncbi:MAG: Methionyl-tRNA synthetase alpha subunit [uncultured bacterium (gcode 4)]|uniref:methionine--tRNA ligase n=1 Tax=uncultured bacterium (gcode 4) TaxID=1234023 RepID=K2G262_9BACT|nr:MAG: Methionyl-tRNA synthetase alpha subunit [uncultured bacterium (gcode 4)]